MGNRTSIILLAGGNGTRMQASIPKQYMLLNGKPLARYSFDLFLTMHEIDEIIVVCSSEYQHLFDKESSDKPIRFAAPGKRRQDSVYNGLFASTPSHELVCIHDAARPFIDKELVLRVLNGAKLHGAATSAMPLKFTVKQSNKDSFVCSTPDRSLIWEIQTPQAIKRDLLLEGFHSANSQNLTVTDDVSLVELIGKQVKLVEGSYRNLKVTVPTDFAIAKYFLDTID
jgi:2-C-methyl-D-erythritol 4-phosphate cytidylyltransferase